MLGAYVLNRIFVTFPYFNLLKVLAIMFNRLGVIKANEISCILRTGHSQPNDLGRGWAFFDKHVRGY